MVNQAAPKWASRTLRLDPYRLPHSVSLDRGVQFSYNIDRTGAVMRRQLGCGLPVSMALPNKSFKGIAARVIAGDKGNSIFTLELHHYDPDLCLPVLVADNLDDIAADWHAWSRMMRLPMLIVDEDNIAIPVREQLGMILVEEPHERRKRITIVRHRPWFLRRRKTGVQFEGNDIVLRKLDAKEIIARN